MRKSLCLLALAACAYAQRPPRPEGTPPAPPPAAAPATAPQAQTQAAPPKPAEEKTSKTSHTIRIGGQEIRYTATAGTMLLKKEDGTPSASIFYIAYVKDDVADPSRRPITFAFNGGPGSSSVWLHMGTFGPKRVLMNPEGNPLPPPYKLVDNEYSLLDATDLVFIDPVSTGYSRAIPEDQARQFHGMRGDLDSVGEFIRLYTSRAMRWASPKFLAGESYGTTRAAALSSYLQQRTGMYLNGIVLLSSILNFATARFEPGNDLPYPLFLPTYTATAWYHKKLPKDLLASREKALAESEKFAGGDYTLALMKGDAVTAQERAAVVKELARLTGLSPDYIDRSNLRVPIFRFTKELLRNERRTVGRFDSRMQGTDIDAAGDSPQYDPSYPIVQGPYTAMWNQYVRADLKFESDLPYEILTGRVQPWSFADYENRYVNVAENLRQAMTENPALQVFVGNGYYDLATPYFATRYTFDHMQLDPTLRGHVSMGYYDAGHMMYIREASLARVKADVARFIERAVPKP